MRRLSMALAAGSIAVVLGPVVTTMPFGVDHAAVAEPPLCERCVGGTVAGADGSLEVRGKLDDGEGSTGRDEPPKAAPAAGRNEYTRVEERLAPACSGNGPDGDALCVSATSNCPTDGEVRFWKWRRTIRVVVAPPSQTVGRWVQQPGTFCLGPQEPGAPLLQRVIAQVRTDFQRLPLARFAVRTDPAPQTLVNVPTAFSAGSAEPVTFTPTILGTRVSILARPVRWDWTFGDGSTLTTDRPGIPRRPDVTHEFLRAGMVSSSVRVTWTGTFTVEGSAEVFGISTPASVQGPPTPVDVRQARTELVSR